jgi:FixJ family two-component response regulator
MPYGTTGKQQQRLCSGAASSTANQIGDIKLTARQAEVVEALRRGKANKIIAYRVITRTLAQSYRDILKRQEGTASSLPRDSKVWDLVETKFEKNLELIREFTHV